MIKHFKTWWTAHVVWITLAASFLVPSFQQYISDHPKSFIGGVLALVLVALKTNAKGFTTAAKLIIVALLLSVPAHAQGAAGAKKQTHAFVIVAKIAVIPVVKPVSTLKKTLGGVLFAVESGVDVVHGAASIADKAFDAIGVAGKVPVVDAVYAVVSIVNTDSGKLDSWLERQETYLFGTHN